MSFSTLFTPVNIGSCSLRNRIIMPLFPTKYMEDSMVTERMTEFYRLRAEGGAALIVLDCPCLDFPRAYKGKKELRMDRPEYRKGIKGLVKAVQNEGARAFMHLNYPIMKEYDHKVKDATQEGDKWVVKLTNHMSLKEADEIVEIMASGAIQAGELGYDGVEIQASYGALIAQILSPLFNKRSDELGGNTEKRARFLIKLIKRVKESAGEDFPVMVKLVCDEFTSGGLNTDEGLEIAKLVEKAGADAIVANGGNKKTRYMTIPPHDVPQGALSDLSAKIKGAVNIPVAAIGKINSPVIAEQILTNGKADLVAMARPLVADPDFPIKAGKGNIEDIRSCVCCLEDCSQKGAPGIGRCCSVNPFAGSEYKWKIEPAKEKKKVLVIGGGPCGIQASIIASRRGHDVELWEQSDELGGQGRLMHIAPFKEEMKDVLRYLTCSLGKTDVIVRRGVRADSIKIVDHKPDVVLLATGSETRPFPIRGIESEAVIDARELYERETETGERVVILGGGDIGCETADWLATGSRKVSIVEISGNLLSRMKRIPRERILARLREKGVEMLTDTEVKFIEESRVYLRDKGGREFIIDADSIILATGSVPENSLQKKLSNKIKAVIPIGDADSPGNIGSALRSAVEAVLRI